MNWSAAPVALVPPGVVTVTSTAPALPAGDVAVIEVALLDREAGGRRAAERHRGRPGEVGAGDGDAGAARGRAAVRADAGDGRGRRIGELVRRRCLVPPGVVTVTSTAPAASAGAVAVIEVALTTVHAGRPPCRRTTPPSRR